MSSLPPKPTARVADAADSLPLPGARTLFARALRIRCPVCAAVAVLTPILVFPWTKLLYLAIDLAFRPVDPDDLESPKEPGFSRPSAPQSQ